VSRLLPLSKNIAPAIDSKISPKSLGTSTSSENIPSDLVMRLYWETQSTVKPCLKDYYEYE